MSRRIFSLSVIQSCELAHHRLLLIKHEGHLNRINTLGLGYANTSTTQALSVVRGFHTDVIDCSDCQLTAQRGIGNKAHSLGYFRHSEHTLLLPPLIFFLYYSSLCTINKSSYLVQSSILMPPLMSCTCLCK